VEAPQRANKNVQQKIWRRISTQQGTILSDPNVEGVESITWCQVPTSKAVFFVLDIPASKAPFCEGTQHQRCHFVKDPDVKGAIL
jgi:hypothetical protein